MTLRRIAVLFALLSVLFSLSAPAVRGQPVTESFLYMLMPLQTFGASSGWLSYQFRLADIDGDGKQDIVWNSRCQRPYGPGGCVTTANYVASGHSRGDGTFAFTGPVQLGTAGWDSYEWFVGDVGGDGRADIIWNSIQGGANYAFVGVSNVDGTFGLGGLQTLGVSGYTNFNPNVGDFNGDGRLDLYWGTVCGFANGLSSCFAGDSNHLRVGMGTASNTFLIAPQQDLPYAGWTSFSTYFGDVNGDGKTDVIWNTTEQNGVPSTHANRVYVGLSNGDGSFNLVGPQEVWGANGPYYISTLVGDVNGDGRADLIWYSTFQTGGADALLVYVGLSNGNGTFAVTAQQTLSGGGWYSYFTYAGDVNGDHKTDLILNSTSQAGSGSANIVYVAAAGNDGLLTLSPPTVLGTLGWDVYRALVGDVNGDGRADIVWNSTLQSSVADANYVYVAHSGYRLHLPVIRR